VTELNLIPNNYYHQLNQISNQQKDEIELSGNEVANIILKKKKKKKSSTLMPHPISIIQNHLLIKIFKNRNVVQLQPMYFTA
jgi:hypothetical protein